MAMIKTFFTFIDNPAKLPDDLFYQAFSLVKARSPVSKKGLEARMRRAEMIAVGVENGRVVTTATFKNPLPSYRSRVFKSAGAENAKGRYDRELGYIATLESHEGQKLCQRLLSNFFTVIANEYMFATSRDSRMVGILRKFGFVQLGKQYDDDILLLVYEKQTRLVDTTRAEIKWDNLSS